ncbi:MAG: hypothetical protein ACI4VF_01280 [Lachnospirales bacterium]
MKRKIVILAVLSTLVFTSIFATGCSENNTDTVNTVSKQVENTEKKVMAKVTAINGDTITYIESDFSHRQKDNGEKPELSERKEQKDLKTDGTKPNGERPRDINMKFDGDEKTVTVDESIIYTNDENHQKVNAKLSDITVDTIISVKYDENETPLEIVIEPNLANNTENTTITE